MMELTLNQAADISIVSKYYPPVAASAITYAVSNFLPYANNFPNSRARVTPGNGIAEPLHLECFLMIRKPPNGISTPLLLVLSFTDQYPQQIPSAVLVAPPGNEKIKKPYPVMSPDGRIQVECLSFLRGVERPYPLLDMLLAISEQFELEYPLVGLDYRSPTKSHATTVPNLAAETVDPTHQALVQEAAEKVVIDINEKASNYLDTREQALQYLQRLNESNRELHKAQEMLQTHQAELQEYVPGVSNVSALLRQLEGHSDTIEEHANCLVPADPLQARALELMAEIHASDDVLALLEDGLKREVFTCDEYVKNVSDVGRDQFVSRFLYLRASEKLKKSDPGVHAPPSQASPGSPSTPPDVPQRLSPTHALQAEFPSTDLEVIRDVLASVNRDVHVARKKLKMMFA
ncbi:hypothetical protein ABL78_0100 [Leptomonas seymouri]|uniref:SB domain-containing protein n=1 Tax=Leptomonas seymouri TaxID=5684 RepID=A0A0N0P9L8_LEPSE|nr:hypothetical protein ABL78_0100 [Leptomonas seymouri]|eukprot:KPI90867.1 hypothetical protein ABL78_0100 [Leptomonas seymouri]